MYVCSFFALLLEKYVIYPTERFASQMNEQQRQSGTENVRHKEHTGKTHSDPE